MDAIPRLVDRAPEAPVMLRMEGIHKSFGAVRVLQNVDLTLRRGEVHALLGENGAGKSTLMKIMFGVVQPSAGRIELEELGPITIDGPRHALAMGIGMVSQELSLVPQLDVAQNIFLGQTRGVGIVPRAAHRQKAAELLRGLAPHLRVDARVETLGMADRQLVEISRTLARGGRIIAFDEPTSSLTPAEQTALFTVIRQLQASGRSIVYISHRMKEIRTIANRVTILRDGAVVASGPIDDFSDDKLNELIAGRELSQVMSHHRVSAANTALPWLELRDLSTARVHDVNLAVRPGEIVGLAGMMGSGRTAIMRAIFGIDARTGGEVLVHGKAVDIKCPADAVRAGIALIPEDRRGHAIVPMMTVEQNFGMASQGRFSQFGVLRRRARAAAARRYVEDFHIRPATTASAMGSLSGGNQQKVVIARWLVTGARVLLFDEPTRGIDVGAKAEIYSQLQHLAESGAAVLVISSELPELLLLSDRIGIVSDGQLTRMIDDVTDLTEETLMAYAERGEAA
jgi:ABC-type sugar transport system ATPase subunit